MKFPKTCKIYDEYGNEMAELHISRCRINNTTGPHGYSEEYKFEAIKFKNIAPPMLTDNNIGIKIHDGQGINFIDESSPKMRIDTSGVTKAKCQHAWKHYQGFTESFEYCDICNEKKK